MVAPTRVSQPLGGDNSVERWAREGAGPRGEVVPLENALEDAVVEIRGSEWCCQRGNGGGLLEGVALALGGLEAVLENDVVEIEAVC